MKILVRIIIIFVVLLGLYIAGSLLYPPLRHGMELISLMSDTMPSTLPVPVAGVRPSGLADTWGAARSGGRRHEGIDIFAGRGTPVISATRGVILRVGTNELGGKIVTVFGPGGYRHYYAHLEDYGRFKEGDLVLPGDTIGFVGTSGNARGTPPHLHYGIYRFEGGAVNPYLYLKPQ